VLRIQASKQDFQLKHIFRVLSFYNIVLIFNHLLLEKKIIFISEHYYLLSVAIQGFKSLLLPFEWHYPCIPILPRSQDELINAFVPYIIGLCLEKGNKDVETSAEDVLIVDLDENKVTMKNKVTSVVPLPK